MLTHRTPPTHRLGLVALAAATLAAPGRAQDTFRVSVDSNAAQASGDSYPTSISGDGRFTAFHSDAADLVAGDTNRVIDVFVHDALTGETERVSVDSSGAQANGACANASISADGRFVVFNSWASNLAPGGANGVEHVYLHDRTTGATTLVSVDSSGNPANSACASPVISADGQVVAFVSDATNLVAGDTNATWDVFVHDLASGATERGSVSSAGGQANGSSYGLVALSSDGQVVAFASDASNLVVGDANQASDVFVRDRAAGVTERVSVDGAGNEGNDFSSAERASISADGAIVAFRSLATNLVAADGNGVQDVFVHDRTTGATELVSVDSAGAQGNNFSTFAVVSSDGTHVAFESAASNLVSGDGNGCLDVFVHDRSSGLTERASVDDSGAEGDSTSAVPLISGDGLMVAFSSSATNLVAKDTNGKFDAFVRGNCPTLASWANYGSGFPGTNGVPAFTSRQNPVLGTTITLDLANSAANATVGLVFVGTAHASIPSTWGGVLLVQPEEVLYKSIPSGGLALSGTVPNDSALCATLLDLQAIELDAGAAHGVSFTPGLEFLLGH